MYKFSQPVEYGDDPSAEAGAFGFIINDMFIVDPYLSECGRFVVDPRVAYGLTVEDVERLAELNQLLVTSTQAVLDVGAGKIPMDDALGCALGAVSFAGAEARRAVAERIASCVQLELNRLAENGAAS